MNSIIDPVPGGRWGGTVGKSTILTSLRVHGGVQKKMDRNKHSAVFSTVFDAFMFMDTRKREKAERLERRFGDSIRQLRSEDSSERGGRLLGWSRCGRHVEIGGRSARRCSEAPGYPHGPDRKRSAVRVEGFLDCAAGRSSPRTTAACRPSSRSKTTRVAANTPLVGANYRRAVDLLMLIGSTVPW